MWRLRRRTREASPEAESLVEFTVPGEGAQVMDAEKLVRLRAVAAAVGCSNLELMDRDGDLVIALGLPGATQLDEAALIQTFCELSGLDLPG